MKKQKGSTIVVDREDVRQIIEHHQSTEKFEFIKATITEVDRYEYFVQYAIRDKATGKYYVTTERYTPEFYDESDVANYVGVYKFVEAKAIPSFEFSEIC